MGYRKPLMGVAAAGIVVLAVACRSAASVVLDLPPQTETQEPRPRTAAMPFGQAALTAAQDTVRSPAERTLDRDSVLALLPRDPAGNVDWVKAVRSGVVKPRRGLPGRRVPPAMDGFALDFYLEGPDRMFDALFPHSSHVKWLDCQGCHPAVFRFLHKSTSMEAINRGEACGQCHGSVAFAATNCVRCHPQMPPPSGMEASLGEDMVLLRDSTVAAPAYPPARFPHWVHRIRYTCTACHPETFGMRLGSTPLTMAVMQNGEACGICHDSRAAFGLTECDRCHAAGTGSGGDAEP
ncbi:MAG: hypothetical protein OER90_20840 [Gemmatimonadota bacterium]|nr:hypothetical protein [Gemmatimonadota bacterium]